MTGRIRPDQSVAVVGGGLLGLTAALRLIEAGARVTVFEAAPDLGGLASAWSLTAPSGPVTWDRFYHVTLASDAAWRELLGELGLDDEIAWTSTRTGYFAHGVLSPVSTPLEFLRLPGLSLLAKVRLAATIARGVTARDWRRLERMPVERWLTRWSGAATFSRFWVPLLESKLGGSWRDTNAAFIWATIQRLTAARRAGIGDERFGAVPGGYARVLDALAAHLVARGAVIECAAPVVRVEASAGESERGESERGVEVTIGATTHRFDHAVITTTPRVAAHLCDQIPGPARAAMAATRYQGVICASVVLRRPLSPYYLTYLMDDLPFTAVVEMTALIPPAWIGGHALVYLPRYAAADDPWFERSDEDIASEFLAGLGQVHRLTPEDVLTVRVARAREVFPLPVLGYSDSVPPIDTGVPGVSLLSSAQIVNGTLNVNETVGLAERGVSELLLGSPPGTGI